MLETLITIESATNRANKDVLPRSPKFQRNVRAPLTSSASGLTTSTSSISIRISRGGIRPITVATNIMLNPAAKSFQYGVAYPKSR